MPRSVADTTPAVRLRCRPSGLPTAKTVVPDRRRAGHHRGHDDLRELVDGQHGDVLVRLAGRDPRGCRGAVGERDLDLGGAVDDVQRREHRAPGIDDHAAAQTDSRAARRGADAGRCVVTVTSEGLIVW